MGQRFDQLNEKHIAWIAEQKIFFVGTAAEDGRVNVSPKGMDTLRVLGPNQILWLNVTGSGNETATHVLENSRMTIMFASLTGAPVILRAYGQAKVCHPRDENWKNLCEHFPSLPGTRQIFDLAIDLVQTSCGMAVPLFDYQGEREQLNHWAEKKGEEGIQQYWAEKNQKSIDGKDTHILD